MKMTDSRQTMTYRPNQRAELGLFKTWRVMAANIAGARNLIWQLFKRDFLAGYKRSFLGFSWVFIAPLFGIVSWVFLRGTGVLQTGDVGIPYPAYVLVGTSVWALFVGFYQAGKNTLAAGRDLVLQINYPHEALLVQQTAQQLANFSIVLMMNLLVLTFMGVYPAWQVVFLPAVVFPLFLIGSGIGLIVSMITIVAVDLNNVIDRVFNLLIWLTPIIYSDKVDNPVIQLFIRWNPLTYLVCSARDIILYGRLYDLTGYLVCSALALALFLLSWRLFFVSEDKIIERMI